MRIAIDHSLTLTLPAGASQMMLHLLLTPPDGPAQRLESWDVKVDGMDNAASFTDAFGNKVHLVNQNQPQEEIALSVRGLITTTETHGVLGRPSGEPVPNFYKCGTSLTKVPVTLYGKYRTAKESRIDVLHALMGRVGETLGLPPDPDAPAQSQAQTQGDASQSQSQQSQKQDQKQDQDQAAKKSPEQASKPDDAAPEPDAPDEEADKPLPPPADYAHAFIGSARALDIPARFVIGYLLEDEDGMTGLHAWAEAYDERLGWVGFDPRRQMCPTERYVRLAVGLDAHTALPLRTVPVVDIAQTAKVSAA